MIIADFTLPGSGGVAAVVAVLTAAVALAAAVASASTWRGSAAVVDVNMLSLALFKADGIHVGLGVVLREGSRVGWRAV